MRDLYKVEKDLNILFHVLHSFLIVVRFLIIIMINVCNCNIFININLLIITNNFLSVYSSNHVHEIVVNSENLMLASFDFEKKVQ